MTTGIIDYIFSLRQQTSMICCFFCDFANRRSLNIRTVIVSFGKQILKVLPIPPELEVKLGGFYASEAVHSPPTVEELMETLTSAVQLPNITYFIIDGIDECSNNDKWYLLPHLTDLMAMYDHIKILISSREEVEISESLDSFIKISLDFPTICLDTRAFVKDKLKNTVEEA